MIVKQHDNLVAGLILGAILMGLLYVAFNNGFSGAFKSNAPASATKTDPALYQEQTKLQPHQEIVKAQTMAENQRNLNLVFTFFAGFLAVTFIIMLGLVINTLLPRQTRPSRQKYAAVITGDDEPEWSEPYISRATTREHLRVVKPARENVA